MADQEEQKKCQNPVCSCVPKEGDYCSPSCEGIGDFVEIDCDCAHPECKGDF